ncbi:hypothetical protein [Bacillus sp. ME78]|uniref:hypothetical protein n=1 Tax=Bacillus sp. ME78 TaxID=2744261 RepID=UPI001603AD20|nr:hypothetical protein [Bacillus sp. ME78]
MNVAEISYKLGKVIQKTEEGKKLQDLMRILEDKVSNETWSDFQNLYTKTPKQGLLHYYSLNYVYELFKYQQSNENLQPYMKQIINEMLSINEFKEASDLSLYFAKSVDKMLGEIYKSEIPKQFGDKIAKPKLKRVIQDLHVSIQRTNYAQFIFKHYKKTEQEKLLKLCSDYEKEKNPYPYSKENREVIGKLATNDKERMFLWYNESIFSIQAFIKQIIFESHFNLIFELKQEDVIANHVKEINSLELFRSKTNQPAYLKRGAIIRFTAATQQRFGLINRSVCHLLEGVCQIEGFLYPEKDKELFIK